MDRSPLYYNPDVGGLSPLQPPDMITSAVLPTLADQVTVQSNRVTLLDSVGNHLLVPVTDPLLNDLTSDYIALEYNPYKVISFETDTVAPDHGYKLADKDNWSVSEVLVGLCLGVIETTTGDAFVFQLSGKLTPLINKGDVTPPTQTIVLPTGITHGYLGTGGNVVYNHITGKRLRVVRTLGTDLAVELSDDGWEGGLSHNVISSTVTNYLTLSGLTATVADDTYAYFYEGAFTKHVNVSGQSVTVPDNQISYIYAKPDGTLDVRDDAYEVVEDESSSFVPSPTLIDNTFVNSSTYRSSNVTVYDSRRVGGVSFNWGQVKTLPAPTSADYYYYELTYVGGSRNAQIGIYVDDCTLSNNFFSASTTNTKGTLHFSVNTTNNRLNNVLNEWTVHDTTAIGALGTNTRISWLVNGQTQEVYLAINGVWRNSGNPVATFIAPLAGRLLVPVLSVTENSVLFTTIANTAFSYTNYPVTTLITNKVKRSVSTNRTYTLVSDVFAYVQLVYLGEVNTINDTATAYPVNGEVSTTTSLSTSATSISHNLHCEPINVTVSLNKPADTTITYVDKDTLTITTSVDTTATVTVANHANN